MKTADINDRSSNDISKLIFGHQNRHGLIVIDGPIYYFSDSGYAMTGYWDIDGVRYYFDEETSQQLTQYTGK